METRCQKMGKPECRLEYWSLVVTVSLVIIGGAIGAGLLETILHED
jgi:hypothetical protein